MNEGTMLLFQTPSHYLLSKDAHQAVKKAQSVNILLHHRYDESLVYMALKSGLKFCDIMYPPCDTASDWGATKCNQQTSVQMTNSDRSALLAEATKTGEQIFYSSVIAEAEKNLNNTEIVKLTRQYQHQRTQALAYCRKPGVLKSVEAYLTVHPYVLRDKTNTKLFHFQTETVHVLDPLTLCLGWFCREKQL